MALHSSMGTVRGLFPGRLVMALLSNFAQESQLLAWTPVAGVLTWSVTKYELRIVQKIDIDGHLILK